ncbi:hypothetical protein ADUPG1_011791, partial [Aduncisulcus paluster]
VTGDDEGVMKMIFGMKLSRRNKESPLNRQRQKEKKKTSKSKHKDSMTTSENVVIVGSKRRKGSTPLSSSKKQTKKRSHLASTLISSFSSSPSAKIDDSVFLEVNPLDEALLSVVHDSADFITQCLYDSSVNHLLVSSGDGTIYIYDLVPAHTPDGMVFSLSLWSLSDTIDEEISCMTLLKEGNKLICGTNQGYLISFNNERFEKKWTFPQDYFPLIEGLGKTKEDEDNITVDCLVPLDKDSLLVSGSDGLIRAVQIQPNHVIGVLAAHGPIQQASAINSLEISCDREYVISGGMDGSLRVFYVGFLFAAETETERIEREKEEKKLRREKRRVRREERKKKREEEKGENDDVDSDESESESEDSYSSSETSESLSELSSVVESSGSIDIEAFTAALNLLT